MTLTDEEANELRLAIAYTVALRARIDSRRTLEDFDAYHKYNENAKVINKYLGETLVLFFDIEGMPY